MKILSVAILFAAVLATCSGAMLFKDQCIYWHNYFRTLHRVPNVTWSMDLQKLAEDWVKYLADNNKFHHSPKNAGNLYMNNVPFPKEYCSDALWWFHNEEQFYNYSNPRYVKAAGHFTMMIWKNTREIGAAWAVRKDGRLVLSIKYKPGGNVVNSMAYNVRPPTAQLLGPEWPYVPPRFARCPKEMIVTPAPTTKPTTTPVTGATMPFKDQCLYWHNYFRTLHQVRFVTWSMSLQKEAEDRVKYLAENNKFEYSKNNSENLFMSMEKPREYCSEAIWWFHSQEKFYNFSNPRYVKAARNFTQVVWKNTKQIGAAWAIRKDNKLVVVIKYSPEGNNYDDNFEENVFPPIAATLPEWALVPPKFARCPAANVPTHSTEVTTVPTRPHVKAAAKKTVSSLELFIGSVILATVLS